MKFFSGALFLAGLFGASAQETKPVERDLSYGGLDLVDTAASAGLDTLVTALQVTGLDAVVKGDGPFTVFAPTNEAFAGLGDILDLLLLDENLDLLGDVLLYHVVAGTALPSGDIVNGMPVTTALGEDVKLFVTGGDIFVQDSTDIKAFVIIPDVVATNGIAHVIDSKFTKVPCFELSVRGVSHHVAFPNRGFDSTWF